MIVHKAVNFTASYDWHSVRGNRILGGFSPQSVSHVLSILMESQQNVAKSCTNSHLNGQRYFQSETITGVRRHLNTPPPVWRTSTFHVIGANITLAPFIDFKFENNLPLLFFVLWVSLYYPCARRRRNRNFSKYVTCWMFDTKNYLNHCWLMTYCPLEKKERKPVKHDLK